jgi:uncharacterized protein
MTDAAAQVEAARKALAEAEATLAAEQAAAEAARVSSSESVVTPRGASRPISTRGPLTAEQVATIKAGYSFDAPALEMGALVNGDALPEVPIRIPIAMLNRHGLVAGATGTGKTRTLQVLAEQLSAAGVPVFAADIKGDLSGLASAGESSEKLLARTAGIGQRWVPAASPAEFYTLGGEGTGIPIRATVSSFGPLLMSKVLGLNSTQESSLGLVFHYADRAGLPLVDLEDLRSVLSYLISPAGKAELVDLGGLSSSSAGVILRELITFADDGADVFFGEPEIDTQLFLRTTADGKGLVSLLELPEVQTKPALFSTFLMWLLADLFNELPEVGDIDKPKLVFFFDEAHLLFKDASKDFISSIVQTVRLIRSKGVGIVFVTQSPKDVPNDVLAQIGSRVQHQLRAHTPDDARALKSTVSTYPISGYDLGDVLMNLATGEAIVTVMNERGAPSPVAWTRLRAPQGSMVPTPADQMLATVHASPLTKQYGTTIDRESAREILAAKMNAAAAAAAVPEPVEQQYVDEWRAASSKKAPAAKAPAAKKRTTTRTRSRAQKSVLDEVLGSRTSQTIVREVLRGVFSTLKKK